MRHVKEEAEISCQISSGSSFQTLGALNLQTWSLLVLSLDPQITDLCQSSSGSLEAPIGVNQG